ncbi:alpha/beta fold hydrolase [Solirubrobacter soli]|uniref:alpha/beta fold hydrolase n=1 Tax=Solirubrobacter soli TaxID=363832 RepID=UPI0003FF6A8B|nr:alpha/beta hydrolase [Solirubrobacter soli]
MSPSLAAYARGHVGVPGPPLVFLHGLTFDHQMWAPVISALPPRRRALAIDLPGHGASPSLPCHDLEPVVEAVHDTVLEAELEPPVVVGHSLGAAVASLYATRHPVAGVVNVDAPMEVAAAARFMQALEPQLRGTGFGRAWSVFRDSMHVELVAPRLRALLAAGEHVSQELVLSYWRQLLDEEPAELDALAEAMLARICEDGIPYLAIYAATRRTVELEWLQERLPHAEIDCWPIGHHFPQLADPVRFATRLIAFAARETTAPR